jgi:chromosome partitioning protein
MICSDFDYIIIDTPPSNGLINRNALTASDSVIIPLQCEYFAMESITAILAMIRNIKTTNNANLGIEGFLFTMFDPNDNFQIQIANEIRGLFGDQVFSDYIPRNNSIPESQAKGIPVIMFRPNSFGAQAYLQVVREIIQKNS